MILLRYYVSLILGQMVKFDCFAIFIGIWAAFIMMQFAQPFNMFLIL